MKCIKTIKKTNSREIGEVIRTEEKDADLKVSTGVWIYCPKSEWKVLTRRVKPASKKQTEEVSEDKPITKRGKNSIQ
jgi:hypothetical protein